MKALSLRQPWAYAVLALGKCIENRRWLWLKHGFRDDGCAGIRRGEQIALHASATKPKDYDWDGVEASIDRFLTADERDTVDVQRGHIIGTARVVDILRTDDARSIVEGNEEKFPHYVIRPDDYARFVRKSAVLPKQDDPEYLNQLQQLKSWWLGPYAFVLEDVQMAINPLPAKGALGFWEVPNDIASSLCLEPVALTNQRDLPRSSRPSQHRTR